MAQVFRRSKCGVCGRLVPSDGSLACKVVATAGDGRALVGRLERRVVGGRVRLLAVPLVACTGCAVRALRRQVEALKRQRRVETEPPPCDPQSVQP